MPSFDVTVIGSGPGGYVAAIRCAQLGMKTALIERYPKLGGTCLNVGCIPSKALLDSSEHYWNAQKHFAVHGIEMDGLHLNWSGMLKRKEDVISQTSSGVEYLMKKNGIEVFHGHGSFLDRQNLSIQGPDGSKLSVWSSKIILATGSKPASLPGVELDGDRVISSTEALKLREIPNRLIVIGGGIIGLELGSVYSRLGSEVLVVEYIDRLIPSMDGTVAKEVMRCLKKQGLQFRLGHAVQEVHSRGGQVKVKVLNAKQEEELFEGDYCLIAVGRKPYTEGLKLESTGLKVDEIGRIPVDDRLQTSAEGIFAIGDVVKGPMLAHKAEEEGVFVAERIAGEKPYLNYRNIPSVLYTWPEAAGVGYTEEELKSAHREYKSGSFPFRALGRARAAMETEGLVKILADVQTDEILGIHMVGARIADLIAEAVVALEYRASAEDLARISHAHPTFAEAIKEAALDATAKRSLHL